MITSDSAVLTGESSGLNYITGKGRARCVPINGLALPASQSMHAAIPCVEYEPGVQSMQTTSDGACVPVRDDALPAGHLSQALWPHAE